MRKYLTDTRFPIEQRAGSQSGWGVLGRGRGGWTPIPVYLACDVDTNLRRVATQERVRSGTTKLTDAQVVEGLRSRCELFVFDCCPGFSIDTTNLKPIEAAWKILDSVFQQLPDGKGIE